ncbi:MAG: hypothetical protein ACHQ7N_10415 [Candidatus Methylomirabilales bacterium]
MYRVLFTGLALLALGALSPSAQAGVIDNTSLASPGVYFGSGNANSNLGFQFDTGNFFCVSRVWTKPADAQAFLEKYASRMGYMHLKTSSPEHKVQQVEGDNELDFDIIFAIATKNHRPYVGFELDQPATLEQAFENHKKSVEYLRGKFGG